MPKLRREIHYGRMMRCFADRPAGVDALLREAVRCNAEGLAVVCGAIRLSYRELDTRVDAIMSNLATRGLQAGDRMGLLVGNQIEFLLSVLAGARLGLIVVPMNVRQRAPEIRYMLEQSQATALVFDGALSAEFTNMASGSGKATWLPWRSRHPM
jgi:long-chain acyl-CoA synthetase